LLELKVIRGILAWLEPKENKEGRAKEVLMEELA
jgi:hypothetical protein